MRISNVNEIPIKNCPVRLCCLQMLVPWNKICMDCWRKGLHRVKGWLKRVSEQETFRELLWELPQEPSSAALLQQWVGWGHHPGGHGQPVWLCPHTSGVARGSDCISRAKGAWKSLLPRSRRAGRDQTPRAVLSITLTASPSRPSLSRSTSRLTLLRLLLFWMFFPGRPPLCLWGGHGGREGRAKTEDSLFLGWLSPTPWKAGCQLGGVAGWHSPVSNTAHWQEGSRDLRHLSAPRDSEPI